MYIKKVLIEGFKSYKEQVSTDPFSPQVNVVVGANGSGKSNFFHAIRFVLSDMFQNLRSEDKHALLHEGSGHQVASAFVEILFDNSDNRIPVDKEEVRLRRTITTKKDEYFLDTKHVSKTEVMNLLESAGFSRSNPYYVVQQGKIATLTLMKDSERLDLLKEIGGTRVYEDRRRESLKIMQETSNKRKQIDQVVGYLEERLKELDEEKEELKKYQQLDKQKRSLEYTLLEHELNDARTALAEMDDTRKKISERMAAADNGIVDAREDIKTFDKEIKSSTKKLNDLKDKKVAIEEKRTDALKMHAQLDLDLRDLSDRIKSEAQAKKDATKKLETLKREIEESKKELSTINDKYQSELAEESKVTKRITECERQLSILYQKQGRATQFANKAARDKWLQKEIDDLERVLSANEKQERLLEEEIKKLNDDVRHLDDNIDKQKGESGRLESVIGNSKNDHSSLQKNRDKLLDTRKSLWKKEADLNAAVERSRSELIKAQKSLDHATPGDIRRGLSSVNRIAKQYNMKGVHGPILELFECDEKFFTAVEVTAGNSLFHVIVDSDADSTLIIRQLTKEKGGRVTFIPLNRVKAPETVYPRSSDVVPLLKKLEVRQDRCIPAFSQVFGRTVICRDLDTATRVARSNSLDCITLDGDQVSRKGGMTGGFYDFRRSKLKFVKIIRENKIAIQRDTAELEEVEKELKEIDQEITKFVTGLQQVDADRDHEARLLTQLKSEIASLLKKKQSIENSLEKKKSLLANIRVQIDQVKVSIAMKRAEMGTELVDQLTPEERHDLSRLNPEITQLKEEFLRCKTNRVETEARKEELETNLSTNLVRRQNELNDIVKTADSKTLTMEHEVKRQEMNSSQAVLDDLNRQLKDIVQEINNFSENIEGLKKKKDEKKSSEAKLERLLQDGAKELDQLMNSRTIYLAKQDDCMKQIRDLGSLPSEAFDTHKKKNKKQLQKLLHDCNEQLKQFSHVNKKALDQYMNFIEQREQLQRRRAELDAGDQKIRELIEALDQRKDESIERTFKGVARHFREVFSELVQGGHGHLVMMKRREGDGAVGDDDHDEDGPREPDSEGRIEKYIGVKVKVSFTGQGETQLMRQLSGGQKTVVALTLIFAIQRCDPAPFYLFDEIDAALDPQYRTAVGNMIRRLADTANTQFITTTFRPELVRVADKIYGVTHKNRVSHVNVVSREQALDFIEHDQAQNAD